MRLFFFFFSTIIISQISFIYPLLKQKIIFKLYEEPHIIVSGDMNDGPGFDLFEEYYLLGDR